MRVAELRDELMRRGLLREKNEIDNDQKHGGKTTAAKRRYVSLLLKHAMVKKMDSADTTTTTMAEAARWIQEHRDSAVASSSSTTIQIDPEQTYRLQAQGIRNADDTGTGIGMMVTTTTSNDKESSTSSSNNTEVVGMACHYLPGHRSSEQASATALALALRWTIRRLGLRHVRWVTTNELDSTWSNLIPTASSFSNGTSGNKNESLLQLSPMLYYQIVSLRDELLEIGSFGAESVSSFVEVGGDDEKCRALALQALETRETWTWRADGHSNDAGQQHLLDKALWMDPMGRDYYLEQQSRLEASVVESQELKPKASNQADNEFSTEMEQHVAEQRNSDEQEYIQQLTSRSDQTKPALENSDERAAAASQPTSARIDPTQLYRLYFDGGSRGNPGPSGAGMALYDPTGEEIWHDSKYLNTGTNNQAEYHAIRLGLEHARHLGIRQIHCCGDSQLIIRQLLGQYKVKNEVLLDLYTATKAVMADFDEVHLTHVKRSDNVRADELAQKGINMAKDADPQPNAGD